MIRNRLEDRVQSQYFEDQSGPPVGPRFAVMVVFDSEAASIQQVINIINGPGVYVLVYGVGLVDACA